MNQQHFAGICCRLVEGLYNFAFVVYCSKIHLALHELTFKFLT